MHEQCPSLPEFEPVPPKEYDGVFVKCCLTLFCSYQNMPLFIPVGDFSLIFNIVYDVANLGMDHSGCLVDSIITFNT